MSAPRSSIALLLLATATAAVGLVALMGSADFWLGSLTTLVAAWLLMAASGAVGGRGRARAAWIGFLAGCGGFLLMSFGPWSDADVRDRYHELFKDVADYDAATLPTSRFLLRCFKYVHPRCRAEIATYDAGGRLVLDLSMTGRTTDFDDLDMLVADIDKELKSSIALYHGRPSSAVRVVSTKAMYLRRYMDVGHILLALLVGAALGLIARGMYRVRVGAGGRRPEMAGAA